MPDSNEEVKKKRTPRKKKIEAEVETDDAAPVVKGGALVIVESPTKAKTIGKYLGRGYTVKATVGHLRDLPKRELGVDVDNNFTPKYVTIKEKAKTLADIKKAGKTEIITLTPEQDAAMRKAMEPVYKDVASRVGQPLIDEFMKETGQAGH